MMRKSLQLAMICLPLCCLAESETEKHPGMPGPSSASTNVIFQEIKAVDTKLFNAIFNDCDLNILSRLLADDFEFYHDKGGLIATNRAQFIEIIRKTCERQKAGQEVRSRRELVSMEVYPLSTYGAVQVGVHRFFIFRDGRPDEAGDIAKFTHVWRKIGTEWKIARVLSYDHHLAK